MMAAMGIMMPITILEFMLRPDDDDEDGGGLVTGPTAGRMGAGDAGWFCRTQPVLFVRAAGHVTSTKSTLCQPYQ